jgi:hypothetical protein
MHEADPTTLMVYGAFSYLNDKRPPDTPLVLWHMPRLGRIKELVKEESKRFAVRITSIKPNKNSPVPQKILKMLPS